MSINLYDISVKSYLQMLDGTTTFLAKGKEFFLENNINPDDILSFRLHSDMLPFVFQLNAIRHFSLGSIQGIQQGVFQPPPTLPRMNYEDFQQFIVDATTELSAYSEDEINALTGRAITFKAGELELPFIAENFVSSFSLPNAYFHITTAYDMLRVKGVPLSKPDFLGAMRTE